MDLLVLDPMVLDLAQVFRVDLLGRRERQDPNRVLRHTAYRQFVLWQHGRLVRGDRRVLPSCAVRKIREAFPDPNNHYTGYVPRRLF